MSPSVRSKKSCAPNQSRKLPKGPLGLEQCLEMKSPHGHHYNNYNFVAIHCVFMIMD